MLSSIVLLLIFSAVLSGCGKEAKNTTTTTAQSPTSAAESSAYQDIVARFKALMPTSIPANLTTDGLKKGGEFDVNTYFSVLTHLSMAPGYVLDYLYLLGGTAGGPILYIRPANDAPFQTYEEYRLATQANPRPANDQSMIWFVKDEPDQKAGNMIKVDGTDEGYFEYALLQTLGNQFYLYGTADINDKRLVCESAELENIITEIQNAGLNQMNAGFLKSARAIDLNPVVKTQANAVLVQFVLFTKWGGFSRDSYLIAHDYPNIVMSFNNEVLLAYQSGARY